MTKSLLGIVVFAILASCNDTRKFDELERRISKVETQNQVLVDSLNYVSSEFIKPFKVYEEIVLSEFENSPNQIISDYKYLIKNYPNSFWKHEAKKRIENIKKRKKYWSDKDGWKLPGKLKEPEVIELIDPEIISCPGC